jgi:hypothetical protein
VASAQKNMIQGNWPHLFPFAHSVWFGLYHSKTYLIYVCVFITVVITL